MKNLLIFCGPLFLSLISCSPAKEVQEELFLKLGNEEQYVEVTGELEGNPVLLFIHGGPGWPQTPQLRYFNKELTTAFTLVSWDQRGCGKSFIKNPHPSNLDLEQLVSDAHELTTYLKEKYHQEKIYLAGFSWGSIIGLKLIEKYPNDYKAYIGISQVININESIKLSRDWIKKQAEKSRDTLSLTCIAALERSDTSLCKTPLECFFKQYDLLTKYKGAIYKSETEAEIQKSMSYYEDYKAYDWNAGFMYSIGELQDDLFNTDLSSITKLNVPVYFFVGRHDHNIPAGITEKFAANLVCPSKKIVWFEKSGHEVLEEEAKLFNEKMIDVINTKTTNKNKEYR